jgi:mannose-6-phosphate isomerase-like protein (cupin superfamily)
VRHVTKICDGIDVTPLLGQLDAHPELWDQYPYRRTAPNSPHAEMVDIWARYNPIEPYLKKGSLEGFNDEHWSAWYPAAEKIPAVKSLALELMTRIGGDQLGAVLITKLPAGAVIKSHVDRGWHATHFNRKLYTILRANEHCINRYVDEEVVMRPGECFSFDNSVVHSVENRGATERIAVVTCIHTP